MVIFNRLAFYRAAALCTSLLSTTLTIGSVSADDRPPMRAIQYVAPKLCANFTKNDSGSWSTSHPVTISLQSGSRFSVGAGASFSHGAVFMGLRLADYLDANCTSPRLKTTADIKG